MPQRNYFYTPIVTENHNIGSKDINGDWVSSNSSAPGAINPSNPLGPIGIMSADSLICLRVDENSGRCVVSLPQSITQIHIKEGEIFQQIELASVLGGSPQDWQQKSRSQIESDYQGVDPNAPDAQIDFTVEEE
tara:strand:+ start:579 stop:980 length:402 start_codon:yes stop_codon:yes gene_type:complete